MAAIAAAAFITFNTIQGPDGSVLSESSSSSTSKPVSSSGGGGGATSGLVVTPLKPKSPGPNTLYNFDIGDTTTIPVPAKEESKLEVDEGAKLKAEEEENVTAEAEEKARAEKARLQAEEEEAELKAEEARVQAEKEAEAARLKAEEEARAEAEAARLKAEEEAEAARLKAEEESRVQAEKEAEEARMKAEEEARVQAEKEAEEARMKAEEEARMKAEEARLREEEAARLKAEEDERKSSLLGMLKTRTDAAQKFREENLQVTPATDEEVRKSALLGMLKTRTDAAQKLGSVSPDVREMNVNTVAAGLGVVAVGATALAFKVASEKDEFDIYFESLQNATKSDPEMASTEADLPKVPEPQMTSPTPKPKMESSLPLNGDFSPPEQVESFQSIIINEPEEPEPQLSPATEDIPPVTLEPVQSIIADTPINGSGFEQISAGTISNEPEPEAETMPNGVNGVNGDSSSLDAESRIIEEDIDIVEIPMSTVTFSSGTTTTTTRTMSTLKSSTAAASSIQNPYDAITTDSFSNDFQYNEAALEDNIEFSVEGAMEKTSEYSVQRAAELIDYSRL